VAKDSPPKGPGDRLDAGGDRSTRLQQLLLEASSLTGSEARVIVAILDLGTATLKQLAEATGIDRSNIYPVLDSLAARGLCERLPGRNAVWECPEPKEVLARLQRGEEVSWQAALEVAARKFEEAGALLAESPSDIEEPAIELVDITRSGVTYLEAMESVEAEVLVLNRGPYGGDVEPSQTVLDALARGVKARALWVSAELDGADPQVRLCADVYAHAGVDQRVVDNLPAAMAVIGQDMALVSLPGTASSRSPKGATVRDAGMVALLSAGFEHLWEHARPYSVAGSTPAKPFVSETASA